MSNNQENVADAISEAKEYRKKGQHEQALAACSRAIELEPNAYEAYSIRWDVLNGMMSPLEARAKITAEVEAFLDTHPETPEALHIAYWGYMGLPGRTKNVPQSLFEKMLQHPGTKAYLSALRGLAERSQNPCEEWEYNRRTIDEFTPSNAPILSWYWGAYQDMLRLAEKDRSLASDDYLDELIERCLQAHLAYCRNTEQRFQWAYIESVRYRLTFGIRLDKALETLERAQARLQEKEEQGWIERAGESLKEAQKDITRLRGEIYLKQERWEEAYDALKVTTTLYPDYLTSLPMRFSEYRIGRFVLLGMALEGIEQFEQAIRYYTDAHFAPNPHPEDNPLAPFSKGEARAGLERIYQAQRGSLEGFEDFLKAAEAEYRVREAEEREMIRQNIIKEKIDQEAPDFTLETLEGQKFTLSAMRGKVVLLDIWASWCGWCIRATPEVEKVYEHFRAADDVVIFGVNDGEHPEKVRSFLEEHQFPWAILLDRNREVHSAYKIEGIPSFILIDKKGRWQYTSPGYSEWLGQELIWLVEALRIAD